LKKKNIYLKKKRLLKRKLQAIFKNQVLNLYLTKYLTKHFSITTQIYIKNIKNFLKNSARKLNKILFKQLRFNKQVKFLKNIIYILNISTYCKSAYFFSEYIAAQLCKSRKQWLIINITTQIITKILKVRLNIKGCKILISGRLQGRDRKKTFLKVFGLLPLQVFSSKISYSLSQNYNVFGAFGVKI
jgi:ribosomal protein S3